MTTKRGTLQGASFSVSAHRRHDGEAGPEEERSMGEMTIQRLSPGRRRLPRSANFPVSG